MVCLVLLAGTSASARDVISSSFTTDNVDLRAVLERIETENAEVRIDLPPNQSGAASSMVATASVFALRHRWAVFSLQNKSTAPQDLVIVSDWQGFVGSGLFWPSFGKQNILSVQSAPGLHPIRLVRGAGDAFAFRINPGETVTYAVEVNTAGLDNLILWKRTSYASHRQNVSMLLGFALLISIGVLCLFVIRPQWVFPAAALFAWAATVFLALEFGYAGWLKALMPGIPEWNEKAKAISEALMTTGFLGCLLTFVDLRRRMVMVAALVLIALLGGLGLAVWGWFRPDVVSGIARMAFAVTSITATLVALMLTSKGAVRAKVSLFFFVAALLWATVSAIAVFEQSDADMYRFLVSSGLVLLMGVMILVIARFAFSRGVIHSKFLKIWAGGRWLWQARNKRSGIGRKMTTPCM